MFFIDAAGFDAFNDLFEEFKVRRGLHFLDCEPRSHIKRLNHLGYEVTLQEAA